MSCKDCGRASRILVEGHCLVCAERHGVDIVDVMLRSMIALCDQMALARCGNHHLVAVPRWLPICPLCTDDEGGS